MLRHDSRYVRAVELLDAGQPLAALVLIETQLGEVEERQRSRGRRRWSVTERDLRVLQAPSAPGSGYQVFQWVRSDAGRRRAGLKSVPWV